ncbi:MAG: hypothetical protein IPK93_01955 [Solirubrobacterales bacterium]|nr:hypothetical protein [Solirubrobacterales bacterium]
MGLPATAWADGTPDPIFGGDGRVTFDLQADGMEDPSDIAVDSQGRIVVVGSIFKSSDPSKAYVARLLGTGQLDTSFDGDGIWILPTPNATFSGVAVDPGDRIVAAGQRVNGGTGFDFLAVRVLASGQPDPGFSGDGIQTVNFGGAATDVSSDVTIDGQGRIVMSGYSTLGGPVGLAVARLTPDGTPDATLNGSGIGIPDVGGSYSDGRSIAIDDQGRIVIAGSIKGVGGLIGNLVIRLRPEGSFDPSFSDDGRNTVEFAVGKNEVPEQVLIDEQKRILVVGNARVEFADGPYSGTIARLLPNGLLDQTFDTDGRVVTGFAPDFVVTRDAGLDKAGRIVTSGFIDRGGGSASDTLMTRFGDTGKFDSTFGAVGLLYDDFFFEAADGFSMAIDPQGRYLLAGRAHGSTSDQIGLVRYDVEYPKPPDLPGPPVIPAGPKCGGKAATISGSPNKDRLKGTRKRDVIAGLGGNDVIKGLGGNDLICGGEGNDKLIGGKGNDKLIGDQGKDRLSGGPGRDRLVGGKGRDTCKGGKGRDRLKSCEPRRRHR